MKWTTRWWTSRGPKIEPQPWPVDKPIQCKTPVVLVSSEPRIVRDEKLPPGTVYYIDGETFCVNGEYPYSKARIPTVFQKQCATCPELIYWNQEAGTPRDDGRTWSRCSLCSPDEWATA